MSAEVPAAVKILILGGMANLVLSYALGWLLSKHRMRGPMQPHHWLLVAHTVSLQQGLLLLGVGFAMVFAKLSNGLAVTGAVLLVAASLFQDFSGIVNWLRGTGDQFAEKSTGWVLASINAVLNTAGLAIAVWGVTAGLL